MYSVNEPFDTTLAPADASRVLLAEGADWCWTTEQPAGSLLRSRGGHRLLTVIPCGACWYWQCGSYGATEATEADARRSGEKWLRNLGPGAV